MAEQKIEGKLLTDLITVKAFTEELKAKSGNDKLSRQGVYYHLDPSVNTDQLDWVVWHGFKLIIINDKSKVFTLETNGGKGPRKGVMTT